MTTDSATGDGTDSKSAPRSGVGAQYMFASIRTWMTRMSVPLSRRWVAKLCRSACTVTCLATPPPPWEPRPQYPQIGFYSGRRSECHILAVVGRRGGVRRSGLRAADIDLVVDYFRWHSEDAHRNALNAHCYWALRDKRLSAQEASDRSVGMSASLMNEFLAHAKKIKFGDRPSWQKRGIGLYWEDHEMPRVNPKSGEHMSGLRRRVKRDFVLPVKDAYNRFFRGLVGNAETLPTATRVVTIRNTRRAMMALSTPSTRNGSASIASYSRILPLTSNSGLLPNICGKSCTKTRVRFCCYFLSAVWLPNRGDP
jgi:hypothetical protein